MTTIEKKQFQKYLEEYGTEEKAWLFWMRWKCQTDLYYLASVVLGLEKAKSKSIAGRPGRKRLDPKMHRKMAEEMMREDDTLQLYPRLHMKSSFIKIWCVQKILQNPMVRIGFWSQTATLVRKELESIKKHFQAPLLKELFPEIVISREKWEKDTKDEFIMYRDREFGDPPQEAQIEVWGVGATVTGHHYDYHVYDDVIDQSTVTTVTQMEKIEDWWEYMQAIKEPTAIEKIIGTRYHMHDIYGRIMAEEFFEPENIIVEKALHGNRPLYSFFTYKDLMKLKKRMGNQKFYSQMMNDPVPREDKIFVPPYPLYRPEQFPRNPKYYITLDPAATTHKHSDDSGLCVGAVDKENPNKIFFVEAEGVKLPPNELADYLLKKIVQYRPFKVGIELGLQQALQPLIDIKIREWERLHNEYIRPAFVALPTGKTAKADKLNRTIGAMIKDQRALFKGVYTSEHELMADNGMIKVFRQMDLYNPNSEKNEDDIIDAAAMMVQTIEHFAPAHWFREGINANKVGYTVEDMLGMINKPNDKKWGWQFAS